MRLWKLAAFAVLVAALGHLIFVFQEAEPTEYTPYEATPTRHVMIEADYFPILCDILIIVIILSGLIGGVKVRKKPRFPDEDYNWWAVMAMRIAMLGVIAVFYLVFLRRRVENKEFLGVFEGLRNLINPRSTPGGFVLAEPTAFDQFVVIMFSLIIIVLIIMFIMLMIRPRRPPEEPLLVPFAEYIWRKKEFTFDGDPRDVVINAYGASLDALHKKGVQIPEHFTPWEFQRQVGSPHLRRLTQLFERARYSTHAITQRDSEEAVEKFTLIQKEEVDIPASLKSNDS
ncbi:MAG: hypothetical protein AYK19_02270 [Theionarchaea archaeon DG-70-1]|nr:MAG: hypothetical protein AYK19_02270 [Theionarchaea archaeon DG-70-1]